MFYGIPADKIEKFNKAMMDIESIYPGNLHAHDMLVTMGKNLSFTADKRFMNSFISTASNQQEKSLLWRLHTLAWAATHALHVPGDFVECGVFMGFSSAVICKYLEFENIGKTFYLYDTFSGLPIETSTEQERKDWQAYYDHDPQKLLQQVNGDVCEISQCENRAGDRAGVVRKRIAQEDRLPPYRHELEGSRTAGADPLVRPRITGRFGRVRRFWMGLQSRADRSGTDVYVGEELFDSGIADRPGAGFEAAI